MSESRTRTKYTYDTTTINSTNYYRTTVTQNAQSSPTQTRAYLYDGLNRLTSETNPEWGPGTATYTYDVACTTTPASAGDLTKSVDAAGNVTCHGYDGLHRVLDEGLSGPTCRHFRYDTTVTPPTGVTVATTLSRIEEAYSDNCTSGKITDEWFSYDALGNLTDLYESTPHSGGFYHTTAQYFPNGAVQSVSGVPSQNTWNFGVEGEGRPSSAVNGSTTWVSSVAYNLTSNPSTMTITYGSGDSDSYTFDPNTERMTNSTFSIGSPTKSYVNGLSWNTDGTLLQFATTDPFNSTNNTTCNYLYDDLGRIGLKPGLTPPTYYAANCGAGKWQQNFTYDAFGNITKTGSSQWQPGYNQSTNRIQLSGSTYDGNGNLTNDVAHTYAWDPNFQNPSTIDGIGLTYDALNRMVEQNASGTYTQILYSPLGKVGTFNGQTAKKASIPLPGGAFALFVPGYSGLIAHKDWLGSTRFISSRSTRAWWADYSYAPFGETSYSSGSTSNVNFTGQAQDTTAGLYDFQYREYSPVQGRWISPDPVGSTTARFEDPQSWNLYVYALNNPMILADSRGLYCYYGDTSENSPDWGDNSQYDLNSDKGTCEGNGPEGGGKWFDDPVTSITVNGDTNDVTTISISTGNDQIDPLATVQVLHQNCSSALNTAHQNQAAVQRANTNWSDLDKAGHANNVNPAVLAAIGIRETGFLNITGDFGHGHGIFQIDDRHNPGAVSIAGNLPQAAKFAAGLVSSNYNRNIKAGYSPDLALAGAVRNYNGTGGIRTPLLMKTGYAGYFDLGTTHNNYVSSVLRIAANCF